MPLLPRSQNVTLRDTLVEDVEQLLLVLWREGADAVAMDVVGARC